MSYVLAMLGPEAAPRCPQVIDIAIGLSLCCAAALAHTAGAVASMPQAYGGLVPPHTNSRRYVCYGLASAVHALPRCLPFV